MRITVRVPATSANLGPGFDCLGLVLELCNEVTADTDAPSAVTWEGEGAGELPTDGSDMVSRSLAFAADRLGVATPPVAIHGRNAVPLERGLGSSSAAAVAGIVLAAALAGDDPAPGAVFELAAAFEGHPDNAAPAVLGGVTIAAGAGPPVRLDPHPDLRPVVLVPERARLPTEGARRALPASVPLADAVANLGAVICGRTTYDMSMPYWGTDGPTGEARVPVFVLSHTVADDVPEGGVYTFVADLDTALAKARETAGDKNVSIMGADTGRQVMDAGAIDELSIHVVPVVFGSGTPLFGAGVDGHVTLELLDERGTPYARHMRYRVVRDG